jgi:hypothetical protein
VKLNDKDRINSDSVKDRRALLMKVQTLRNISRVRWQLITVIPEERRISILRVKQSSLGCSTRTTRCNVTENLDLLKHCCANLKLVDFLFSMAFTPILEIINLPI